MGFERIALASRSPSTAPRIQKITIDLRIDSPKKAEEPVQEIDAWFAGFAPAERPRLAIAVMIANAEGGGGEIAAPIAAQVLAAGLTE